MPTIRDFVEAYEAYDGDNLDWFIERWEKILAGETDFWCRASKDGVHWISDGSCDECGAKNLDDG